MQMFDNLIDTLHGRYAETFGNAAETATCQWHRLMARLTRIEEAINNQGDTVLRIPYVTPLASNQPTRMRTLRTGESIEIEAATVDAAAGLLTVMRDGVVVYAKTYAAAETRPGEGTIIIGPGEVTINAVNACNLYLQCKFIADPETYTTDPKISRAGERGIGVDPRENPGAADQGRHSLMQPTMIGASKIAR